MKNLIAAFALCAAGVVLAAVKPGENSLLNGRFEADQVDMPLNWVVAVGIKPPEWLPSGGPGGRPAIRFTCGADAVENRSYRQYGLNLSSNGTYRLTFQARTKGFKAKQCGVAVVNLAWKNAAGITAFPETSGWKKYEHTFKCFPSNDGSYSYAIYANGFSGTFEIADARLEAVDEIAMRETRLSSLAAASVLPRIVPWTPRLFAIDRADPKMTFRYFGSPLENKSGYEALLTLKGQTLRRPLAEYIEWTLPAPDAEGLLDVAIADRSGGTNIYEKTFAYGTVAKPKAGIAAKHRRLNNLVTEVLAEDVPSTTAKPQTLEFSTTSEGWVFVKVDAKVLDDFELRLDGDRVMDAKTDLLETLRRIPAGPHTLGIHRAWKGRVTVRQIPRIDYYSPGRYNAVDTNPKYDWEWLRKHAFPVMCSMHGSGDCQKPYETREWRGMGREWYTFFHTSFLSSADELVNKLSASPGMNAPWCNGDILDEQTFGRPEYLIRFTEGLWKYQAMNPSNTHIIASCTIGKPCNHAVDQDYFAACVNASRGRGLIRAEVYYRGKETEEEARNYIKDYGNDVFGQYRQWYPLSISASEIIFGIFTQTPVLNLNHYPSTDYKYFLEMQYHDVATNPVYDGLAGISVYAGNYADEEMFRWTMKLIRHYGIEGGTEMLAPKYGLSYTPGHIVNCDFRESLEGWTAAGDIANDRIKNFGVFGLVLYDARGGLGDAFARFRRGKAPNTLAQTAKRLVPGRLYSLQYATLDPKAVRAGKYLDRKVPLEATLGEGAEIRKDLSWTWVDNRVPRKNGYGKPGMVNLTRIVFKAKSPELPIAFSDAGAAEGEELGVTYISLNPYVE